MNCRIIAAAVALALVGASVLASVAAADAEPLTASTTTQARESGETGITMYIDNDTDQTLTLVSAENPYGHWQARAPQTILPRQAKVTVSDYSSSLEGSAIGLSYQLPDGNFVCFNAYAPAALGNSADSLGSNDPLYSVTSAISGGWHPIATFSVQAN